MKIFITVIQTSLIKNKQSTTLIKNGHLLVSEWNSLFPCKNNREDRLKIRFATAIKHKLLD